MITRNLLRASAAIPITSQNHPDLHFFYDMEGITGSTVPDQSLQGRDATISGATTETGVIGNALFCDGVDDSFRYSSATPFMINDETAIIGWFDAQASGTVSTLFHYSSTGTDNRYCGMYVTSSNTIRMFGDSGTGSGSEWDFGAVSRDTFIFVVAQKTPSGDLDLWVNNSQKTGSLAAGPNAKNWVAGITGNCHIEMGNITRQTVNVYNSVSADLLRGLNRNATSQEISDLYNGGSGA